MKIDNQRESHNQYQREYYESRTFSDNKRVAPIRTPYIQNHLDKFLAFADLDQDDRTIDIGAGMGKFTIPLVEQGYKVEAQDLSPVLLEELTNSNYTSTEIPTHCGDILNPSEELVKRYESVVGFFVFILIFQ